MKVDAILENADWVKQTNDIFPRNPTDSKHMGPGPHPSGSDQDVHAGDGTSTASQTESPEFKKWFGNSKVVDSEGPAPTSPSTIEDTDEGPKVVFHGTSSSVDFTEFDNQYGRWEMFSESREYSEEFGDKIMEVYLSIENPLDLTGLPYKRGDARNELLRFLEHSDFGFTDDDIETLKATLPYEKDLFQIINNDSREDRDTFQMILESRGFDGFRFPDYVSTYDEAPIGEVAARDIVSTTWVPFHATQIKSATDNSGAFDPNDPDITKHMGPGPHPSGSDQDVHAGGGGGGGVDETPAELIERELNRIERQKPYKEITDTWIELSEDQDALDLPGSMPKVSLPNNPNVQLDIDIGYLRPGGIGTLKATQQHLVDMLEEADQHDLSDLHRIYFGMKKKPHPHRKYGGYNVDERVIDIRIDALHEMPRTKNGFHADSHHEATITHEIGHLLHDTVIRKEIRGHNLKSVRADWSDMFEDSLIGPESRRKTAAKVSGYATTEPIEFVAETFAGVRSGKIYPSDVMSLYRHLDGPPLPKPKEWWEF